MKKRIALIGILPYLRGVGRDGSICVILDISSDLIITTLPYGVKFLVLQIEMSFLMSDILALISSSVIVAIFSIWYLIPNTSNSVVYFNPNFHSHDILLPLNAPIVMTLVLSLLIARPDTFLNHSSTRMTPHRLSLSPPK